MTGPPLYSSPKGLIPYQIDGIAQWLRMHGLLCTWEPGTGKSHLALAGGALLVELERAGLILILCEQNKLDEWLEDYRTFTSLRAVIYRGTPAKRAKIRDSLFGPEPPQVLVATYETARNDLGKFEQRVPEGGGKKKKVWVTGPLHETLLTIAQERGLAVVADESTRLGNRYQGPSRRGGQWVGAQGSLVYKGLEVTLAAIRKVAAMRLWIAGLTGTPVETSIDNTFNQVRLISPEHAGSIAGYERDYVRYRPLHGTPKFQNISPDYPWQTPGVTPFTEKIAPILSHKRKDDPDVRAAFPVPVEEPMYVNLHPDHLALYRAIESLGGDPEVFPQGMEKRDEDVLFGILRQVAAHPMALPLSNAAQEPGKLANLIVERVGRETFARIPSYKERELVTKLERLVLGIQAQVVVFTFFTGIIPILEEAIRRADISVTTYSGALAAKEREANKAAFKAGEASVLICSDAGARGMNLPEASYGINFELCLTDAKTKQRINRYNRLDSTFAQVTSYSMIALDTIEEAILSLNLNRQGLHEAVLSEGAAADGDDSEGEFIGNLDADARRALFERHRLSAAT